MTLINIWYAAQWEVVTTLFGFRKVPPLKCVDGFEMSVQASETHYCEPRDLIGPYTAFEVGYPSAEEALLLPYIDDDNHPTSTVYAYVPAEIIEQVIARHGGIAS